MANSRNASRTVSCAGCGRDTKTTAQRPDNTIYCARCLGNDRNSRSLESEQTETPADLLAGEVGDEEDYRLRYFDDPDDR
jgi:hypothetical protein